ncbi:uncharacterized protein FRV6_16712 [Fusarium oxysporum]|uniref:Uncharacterized protein n=1 Tax=Fusarium oxysporum TaxID=5507 RepID=A0A2H3TVE6_FUSOX|nr:uncharacterized protein FRV6_16712 [Fusarium oxysporum]
MWNMWKGFRGVDMEMLKPTWNGMEWIWIHIMDPYVDFVAREYQRNRRLVDGPGLADDTQTAAAGSTTTYAGQRPWLERTRWETTYKNRDRSLLRCLIKTPYLQLYGRPDAPPYLLASADQVPGLSVDLTSPREDEALTFCFRAYRIDAKQRERLVGVRFNKKLDGFLNAIWHHEDLANSPLTALGAYPIEVAGQAQQQAEEMGEMRIEYEDMDIDGSVYEDLGKADDDSEEEEVDDSELSSTSDYDDGDDSGNAFRPIYDKNEEGDLADRPEQGVPLTTLTELVFGLSLALCTERLMDGQPSSTVLVYFSGILAFSEVTNSFLSARAYTPYLSGLIYIQRLLFLERALPLQPRYMVMGSQSSFEEFVSLRAYGQSVSWGQGVEISMGQFRALTEYLIKEVNGLCNSLMFGLEPDIDLSQIKDDMANNDNGYSFVMDPQNKLTSAYLDLLKRACTARHGCLSRGNCWNWSEVDRYRKKEEDFRELLGPAMSLTGGQQPRWPELSSLWVENDELGPRGLYVYKGYFIYVVRHHKAKSSTNREFVVVRFLPAELALAVFKYCTYIRPFINLLDRERGVNNLAIASQSSSPLLFRTQSLLSNSKPWHTGRFTNVLRKVTFKVWGFAVNSRLLRQICIGITEKHVREVFQPFNRFDDRSKDAHRNVVFAWQSGHRPLQRGFTYGLDGAFPTTMQPQLLNLYEWASLRWHEFLHLPSRLRPRTNAQIQSDRERILGHQPNVTAEDMRETAERLISETQLTPDRKRVDAESRGHEQKSPSPGDVSWIASSPAKRRRVRHVAMSPVDEISPCLTESEAPELFGNLHEPCSHDDIKERRAVIRFLHKYSSARSEKWRLHDRLTRVYETLEWWEFVGCQLCFVTKGGQPEPDHTVESCFQSTGNEKARQILRWLESLSITCYEKNGRRGCSVCAPFMPCREVVYADAVLRAKSPTPNR